MTFTEANARAGFAGAADGVLCGVFGSGLGEEGRRGEAMAGFAGAVA